VAFVSTRGSHTANIWTLDLTTRTLRNLTGGQTLPTAPANLKGAFRPAWSPDGRWIAFTSDRNGSPQIYIMDDDGTNVRRLIEEGGHAVEASWSSDGQRIAFAWMKTRTSNFDIYIHELAKDMNTQITHDSGDNERPRWAPDGRHIVFESSRNGTSQIYSMLLDGTKVRQRIDARLLAHEVGLPDLGLQPGDHVCALYFGLAERGHRRQIEEEPPDLHCPGQRALRLSVALRDLVHVLRVRQVALRLVAGRRRGAAALGAEALLLLRRALRRESLLLIHARHRRNPRASYRFAKMRRAFPLKTASFCSFEMSSASMLETLRSIEPSRCG